MVVMNLPLIWNVVGMDASPTSRSSGTVRIFTLWKRWYMRAAKTKIRTGYNTTKDLQGNENGGDVLWRGDAYTLCNPRDWGSSTVWLFCRHSSRMSLAPLKWQSNESKVRFGISERATVRCESPFVKRSAEIKHKRVGNMSR
jgi:hypothetical protein